MYKMEKGQLWMIVGITLVVAVVASLITISVTGNIVKVPTSVAVTQTDVYTKAEMDTLLSQKISLSSLKDKVYVKNIKETKPAGISSWLVYAECDSPKDIPLSGICNILTEKFEDNPNVQEIGNFVPVDFTNKTFPSKFSCNQRTAETGVQYKNSGKTYVRIQLICLKLSEDTLNKPVPIA